MARHWRSLALATLAAAAVGLACAVSTDAQEPAKSAAKKTKAKAKAPEAEEAADGEAAKTPAKKKRQDPAEAQRAIEAALKSIEAGKAEAATQALSAVIAGGNLPPAMMAKALFYRGVAYRQQKMPAQAIADLTSALWLKGGLGGNDRADAMRQRTSAYQEAGLAESGEPLAPATVSNAPRAPTRTASVEQGWGSEASPSAPATKQSGSGWNPFAGWFGGSSSPSASPPPPPQPTPTPPATASIDPSEPSSATPPGRPRTSAWTRNTEVHTSNPPPAAVASPAPAAAVVSPPPAVVASPAPAAKPEGRFRIQVGMVRTEHEAQALAAKVRRDYAAALAAREPEIDEAVVGNMGSFYRVRVGPFASQADGHAACAKLKGSGLDCLVVAQ
jgi:sporulation related protein